MSRLVHYSSKRDLKKSPEPKARIRKSDSNLIFVVQKHYASHLHYDLRLELDGVLKSWAVPKGPPTSPNEKRLAIHVEDHPYEYKDFFGTIPEGHYGAGEVEIYDSGTYEAVGAKTFFKNVEMMRAGLKKGHLSFELKGKKLKGEYALVKMSLDDEKDQWLWLKKDPSSKSKKKKIKPDPMPKNPKPMLTKIAKEAFDNPNWLFEIKWDGYRCLALIDKKGVHLVSRNQKSFNEQFNVIAHELEALEKNAILDGEVVALDDEGRSDFQLIQNYKKIDQNRIFYYVFDLIYYDGGNLQKEPLIDRKKLLKKVLTPLRKSHIRYSDHILEHGVAFFKEIKKLDLEGMVAKDIHSPYVMKRSSYWQKIKTHKRQEVVIGGFTAPKGKRPELGSLLIGVYEQKNLIYVGSVGTGFDEDTLLMLKHRLMPLKRTKCPFSVLPKTRSQAFFVRPKLICEVSFTEWTKDGIMRHPVFLGLREDKNLREVVKE